MRSSLYVSHLPAFLGKLYLNLQDGPLNLIVCIPTQFRLYNVFQGACGDGRRTHEQRLPYLQTAKDESIARVVQIADWLQLICMNAFQCDQRRPECGRRLRRKYTCAGYYREAVFHNASPDGRPNPASALTARSAQQRYEKIEETRALRSSFYLCTI